MTKTRERRKGLSGFRIPWKELTVAGDTWQEVAGEGSWTLTSSTRNKQGVNWKWDEAVNSQSLLPLKCSL